MDIHIMVVDYKQRKGQKRDLTIRLNALHISLYLPVRIYVLKFCNLQKLLESPLKVTFLES